MKALYTLLILAKRYVRCQIVLYVFWTAANAGFFSKGQPSFNNQLGLSDAR